MRRTVEVTDLQTGVVVVEHYDEERIEEGLSRCVARVAGVLARMVACGPEMETGRFSAGYRTEDGRKFRVVLTPLS